MQYIALHGSGHRPGDHHVSEAHSAGSKELVHVLTGSISVEAGDQVIDLATGDAVSFPGDIGHAYRNRGDEPARFSLAVFFF